jgi:ABC-type Fe3+/spermidine/putrescine transport system ATPase subunit
MEAYGRRMINQLSGGQQQRVALARALVVEPDVVLLDEPLSNLDARLRVQMRQEIRRIHDETGMTMVYVTHDQKESLSMAERIAVMSMGRVEQIGTPRAIYRSPANLFVADFIGETNRLPGRLAAREAGWATVRTTLGTFRARLGPAPVAEGDEVVCMIRPECLTLGAAAGENVFTAVMKRNMYLGELEQFELDTGAAPVRAVCANPGAQAYEPGVEVQVCFDANDAVVLKGEA